MNYPEKSGPPESNTWKRILGQFSLCFGVWGWLAITVLAASTVVTFYARHHWIADLFANLRVQQVLVISCVLLCALVIRRWRLAVLAALLIALHLPWFANAFPSSGSKVPSAEGITVTSVNVLSSNRKYSQVIADLRDRDSDVVVVLELTSELDARLRQGLGKYSHAFARPQQIGNFGIGIYSKFPITDTESFQSIAGIDSIAVTVTVGESDAASRQFRVFATHLLPPMNRSLFKQRNDQLRDVARRVKGHRQQFPGVPAVLVGDLNLTPWSPLFSELQLQSGLKRGIDAFSLTPTWYRFPGFPFGLVLDHGLVEPSLVCTSYQVGPSIGSDHRSITIRLTTIESGTP